jgi:putative SOS response-associated peptidase YedK
MCGRYTQLYTWAEIHAMSGLAFADPPDPEQQYNFAPTLTGWVMTAAEDADAEPWQMRWGLVPGWAKGGAAGRSMINARVETVATKPAFRNAWRTRRCLVPASGYYEWRADAASKQPYYIQPVDAPLLLFAGLWERWRQPDGGWLHSYAIVTREAEGGLRDLHQRMPLMLSPPLLQGWLGGTPEQAAAAVDAAPPPALAWHPVTRAVGNVRSQGPGLIEPVMTSGPLL